MDENQRNSSLFGIFLLIVSLFSDGMLAEYQRRIRETSTSFTAYDMMESTSRYCAFFCVIYSIVSKEILLLIKLPSLEYLFLRDFFLICCLGALGQLFIFYTIMLFGPIVLSVVTTTRKFFTVLCSILIFQHTMNFFQWISVLFVFTGVGIDMFYNIKIKKEKEKKCAKITV